MEGKRTATVTVSEKFYDLVEKFAKVKKMSFSEAFEYLATIGCGTIAEAQAQAMAMSKAAKEQQEKPEKEKSEG